MAKQTIIPNGIFDYIHVAQCKKLFLLTWYDDLTYADEIISNETILKKSLFKAYCNSPSCNSPELEYLQRESFFQCTIIKYNKTDWE